MRTDPAPPTLEDVFAASAALATLERAGADEAALDRAARRMIARARIAMAWRAAEGRAHPRYGDGGLAAAAWSLRPGASGPPGCGALLRGGARICALLAPPRPKRPAEAS